MKSRNVLSRFAVAIGGFLIFSGIILTVIFIINFVGEIDISLLGIENLQNLSLMFIFIIGSLDLVAGILLWRKWFEMKIRKILSVLIGLIQSGMALISTIITILLFFGFIEIELFFNTPSELFPIFLLILSLFSLFSLVNGIFLIRDLRS